MCNMVDKKSLFERLTIQAREILLGGGDRDAKLQAVCSLLAENVPYYNWVGFYIADSSQKVLNLGPYVGEATEHTTIPFGRGICGQAAASLKTFVVQDVAKQANYLACSLKVKAEIVLPIVSAGRVLAELDIDSHQAAPFDEYDVTMLEKICDAAAEVF